MLLFNANLLLRGLRSALTSSPGQATRNVFVANFDLRQQQYTAGTSRAVHYDSSRSGAFPAGRSRDFLEPLIEPLHQQCGNSGSLAGSGTGKANDLWRSATKLPGLPENDVDSAGRRPEFTRLDMKTLGEGRNCRSELCKAGHFPGGSALHQVTQLIRGAQLEIVGGGIAAVANDLDFGGMQGAEGLLANGRVCAISRPKSLEVISGHWTDIESAFTRTAKSLDPNVTVRLHPIEESVSTALVPAKMSSAAGIVLSGFALILAASGIYGVVAFAITRRRKEMGIRIGLGRRTRQRRCA